MAIDAPLIGRLESFLALLSREPDFDAPELCAYDAADLLLLEAAEAHGVTEAGELVVIGDRYGALTLGAAELLDAQSIRVHQDPLLAERALAANAARLGLEGCYQHHPLGESLLSGAGLVFVQLPRSLVKLDEIAWNIARWAGDHVTVLAGGRDKHMTHSMKEVLAGSFERVAAG